MRYRISLVSNIGEVDTFNGFLNVMYRSIGLMVWNYDDDTPSTLIDIDIVNNDIELAVYDSQTHLYNGMSFHRFATDEENYFTDNVITLI